MPARLRSAYAYSAIVLTLIREERILVAKLEAAEMHGRLCCSLVLTCLVLAEGQDEGSRSERWASGGS
jgi:hypothetical protein